MTNNKIAVDVKTLMEILSVGRHTAEKIGSDAGAVIKIGSKKIYNLDTIRSYLNSIEGNGVDEQEAVQNE